MGEKSFEEALQELEEIVAQIDGLLELLPQ